MPEQSCKAFQGHSVLNQPVRHGMPKVMPFEVLYAAFFRAGLDQ